MVQPRQQVGAMEHPFQVCMGAPVAHLAVGVHNRARIRLMGGPEERTSSASGPFFPRNRSNTFVQNRQSFR